jgi:hypothetical protein
VRTAPLPLPLCAPRASSFPRDPTQRSPALGSFVSGTVGSRLLLSRDVQGVDEREPRGRGTISRRKSGVHEPNRTTPGHRGWSRARDRCVCVWGGGLRQFLIDCVWQTDQTQTPTNI